MKTEQPSKSATELKALINTVISDCEVTPDENRKIVEFAQKDVHIGKEEKALLDSYHQMLSNGTIKMVPKKV